jgi:hypothetical protein
VNFQVFLRALTRSSRELSNSKTRNHGTRYILKILGKSLVLLKAPRSFREHSSPLETYQHPKLAAMTQNIYKQISLEESLQEILYYVSIQFAITCDYLSFVTMFYNFYN